MESSSVFHAEEFFTFGKYKIFARKQYNVDFKVPSIGKMEHIR